MFRHNSFLPCRQGKQFIASLSEGTMMDHYTSSYATFQYHSDCQCLHKTAMGSCWEKAANRRYLLLGALPGADSPHGALGAY